MGKKRKLDPLPSARCEPEQGSLPHGAQPTIALLSAFYPHLKPLSSLLPQDIARPEDREDFRRLLQETVVCDTTNAVVLRVEQGEELAMSRETSFKELLERVRTRLFTLHAASFHGPQKPLALGRWVDKKRPPNILTAGFEKRYTSDSDGPVVGGVSMYANTTVDSLCRSEAWETLLYRIGQGPLYSLFSCPTTAVFTPLPNFCYLQISGQCLSDLTPRHTILLPSAGGSQQPEAPKSPDARRRCDRPRKRGKRKSGRGDEGANFRGIEVPELRVSDSASTESPATKRRKLGMSTSALQLTNSPVKATLHLTRSPLRATQSGSVLLTASDLRRGTKRVPGDLKNGRPVKKKKENETYSPNVVLLPRTRMFHACPCRQKDRRLNYGFLPQHIFSRLSTAASSHPLTPNSADAKPAIRQQASHLIKYIFPRQFGLFNPFTSLRPAKNYAPSTINRSAEIAKLGRVKLPPRLRAILPLLEKMIKLQRKCRHRRFLDRHCPSKIFDRRVPELGEETPLSLPTPEPRTQVSASDISLEISHSSLGVSSGTVQAPVKVKPKPRFADYLCTHHEVEGYVIAVLNETIPRDFYGSPSNQKLVYAHVSQFIRFRRFETATVHVLLQGFSISDCDWLRPPKASRSNENKPNQVEMAKRKELLADFLYWLFDGFIIELLRGNFNVTEGSGSKNQTLYFRQDDWRAICKPQWAALIKTNFESIPKISAMRILRGRELGFSYVRLLPKETGMRPIMNLGMRPKKTHPRTGLRLGASINTLLQGVFHVLNSEKTRHPRLVGASVDMEAGIYPLLKCFKAKLSDNGKMPKLYFVKVDVRAAFDTIKQDKLLEIVSDILTEAAYRIQKYDQTSRSSGRVAKKWLSKAFPNQFKFKFPELAALLSETVRHAVFTDKVDGRAETRGKLLEILKQHVTQNIVQIKGKFYRQKDGIPQGSILSSLLCNVFYGNMEQTMLTFTSDEKSLLMRYVDDTLFVTARLPLARQFLHTMHQGIPEYGCFVSGEKILTNFDASLEGIDMVPMLTLTTDFPFCGLLINTTNLDVKAETARYVDIEIADKLTVEKCRKPGEAFIAKMLLECRRRTHAIYSDTNGLNTLDTAYLNVYQSFLFVALKFRAYIREWGVNPGKRAMFFIGVIRRIQSFVCSTIKSRLQTKVALKLEAQTQMKRSCINWLGAHAFYEVLGRKPGVFGPILKYLKNEVRLGRVKGGSRLGKVIDTSINAFVGGVVWKRKP